MTIGFLRKTMLHGVIVLITTLTASGQYRNKVMDRILKETQTSAVILDWKTGRIITATAADHEDLPGSTLKPLLLNDALKLGIVKSGTTVYCSRTLRVGAIKLPCAHPKIQAPFDAEQALAQSCNTWFAEMAKRFTSPQLELSLERAAILHAPMRQATVNDRQLAVLGIGSVRVTPLILAKAYREMLQHAPEDTVVRGLRDSVQYGMANNARVPHIDVLGKTGTAAGANTARTHGWFAGAVPGELIVAIYVPDGNGAAAATIAAKLIAAALPDKAAR